MNPHFIECGFNCIQDRFLGGIFLELEQHYPKLVNKIIVKFYGDPENHRGQIENHSDGTYTIRVNKDFQEANNRKQIPFTLSHEIQHVMQGLERNVKAGRFADVGGTIREYLYQHFKRGKL
jgi:hypothetical protein